MNRSRLFALPLLLASALAFAACAAPAAPAAPASEPAATTAPAAEPTATTAPEAEAAPAEAADIVDTAVAAGSFTTLVAAVEAAGLVETLKDPNAAFTVFAPTDEAFAALPEGAVDALLADPEQLAQVLLFHVLPAKVMAADVTDGLEADSAQGGKLAFTVQDGKVTVNGANVVAADVAASNGVIHVIDAVLLPPSGEEAAAPEAAMAEMADIVDTAVAAGSFTTLVAAVEAAGLVETLKDPNAQFTVFAPTDEAFAALPAGALDALLADPEQLAQVLLLHVVPAKVMAADVTDGLEADSAQGGKLTFTVQDGKVTVNGANVVAADVAASNGVIHVIDHVLLPAN